MTGLVSMPEFTAAFPVVAAKIYAKYTRNDIQACVRIVTDPEGIFMIWACVPTANFKIEKSWLYAQKRDDMIVDIRFIAILPCKCLY